MLCSPRIIMQIKLCGSTFIEPNFQQYRLSHAVVPLTTGLGSQIQNPEITSDLNVVTNALKGPNKYATAALQQF